MLDQSGQSNALEGLNPAQARFLVFRSRRFLYGDDAATVRIQVVHLDTVECLQIASALLGRSRIGHD